jgi:hypothetical protein
VTPLIVENLLSPPVLFFTFGVLAAALGSGLNLPKALSESLTIFLLIAIGYKGGIALAEYGIPSGAWILLLAGALLSLLLPVAGYFALRRLTNLSPPDAAVTAAHYGSVSVVTFMAAVTYVQLHQQEYSGHMVAMLVIMEIPAVLSGIWIARRVLPKQDDSAVSNPPSSSVFINASILLLLGSLIIGVIAQGETRDQLKDFLIEPLLGVLCLFLLGMGLKAGRQISALRSSGWGLLFFGIAMPLFSGFLALAIAVGLQASVADTTLFAVLAASASYIVVPAAMQIAVPQANSELGTSLSIGVTFPFNIIVGIPLFFTVASTLSA